MTTSLQTRSVWKRFCAWYGADVVERKYGPNAPEDWAKAIDRIDRNRLDSVLADVRMRHPTWPPSLHEFEELSKPKPSGPCALNTIDDHLRTLSLTLEQYRGLVYLGRGTDVTGVQIPMRDGTGTFRVMLRDIVAGAA